MNAEASYGAIVRVTRALMMLALEANDAQVLASAFPCGVEMGLLIAKSNPELSEALLAFLEEPYEGTPEARRARDRRLSEILSAGVPS